MSNDTKFFLSRIGILFGILIATFGFAFAMGNSTSTTKTSPSKNYTYKLLPAKASLYQTVKDTHMGYDFALNTPTSETDTYNFLNTESGENYQLSDNDEYIISFKPVPESDSRYATMTISQSKIKYKAFGNSKNRQQFTIVFFANKSNNLKISNKAVTTMKYAFKHNFINPATGN